MNAEMTTLFEQTLHLDENHRVEVTLKEWTAGTLRPYTDFVLTLKVWNGQNVEFGDAQIQSTVLETTQRHQAIREAIKVFDQAAAVVSYVETRTPEQIAYEAAKAVAYRAYDAFERAKADARVTENAQRQGDYWKDTYPVVYAAWTTYQDALALVNQAAGRTTLDKNDPAEGSR